MKSVRGVLPGSVLALAVSCLAAGAPQCHEIPSQHHLRICVIDVGQGDAILVMSPEGKYLLVDGGNKGYGNSQINPLLDSLGITHLDYIVASHYDADHIGGLDEVITHISQDSLLSYAYDRGHSKSTKQFQEYAAAVGSKRKTIAVGDTIRLDDVVVECVAVNSKLKGGDSVAAQNENDFGVCLKVRDGSFSMFLPGDIAGMNSGDHRDVETPLAPQVGDVDVYKVSHHGSGYSSREALLATLKPEASVISVGGNTYGHPTQEAIDRLVAAGSYVYQTEPGPSDTGTIPDGKGKVVNGDVWIEIGDTPYTVTGDTYSTGTDPQ